MLTVEGLPRPDPPNCPKTEIKVHSDVSICVIRQMQDMVGNRMTACCVLLESYAHGLETGVYTVHISEILPGFATEVGVVEDPQSGEELEEEVRSKWIHVF